MQVEIPNDMSQKKTYAKEKVTSQKEQMLMEINEQ